MVHFRRSARAQQSVEAYWETPPRFDRYRTADVVPGDLLYLPRGTAHTVRSTTESIHVSIGFVPVTLRDAIMAALDHLSDLERPLRDGVAERADGLSRGEAGANISARVRQGLELLRERCQSDAFIEQAMEHRTSRMIAALPKLPSSAPPPTLTPQSRVRQSPLAMAHLIATHAILRNQRAFRRSPAGLASAAPSD